LIPVSVWGELVVDVRASRWRSSRIWFCDLQLVDANTVEVALDEGAEPYRQNPAEP